MILNVSEKLQKAGTVDFKKTPRTEGWDKVSGVSTQGSRGLPFLVPEILEFLAFRDSEKKKKSSNFPRTFPEFSSGTPERIPQTATAFSSFLNIGANSVLPPERPCNSAYIASRKRLSPLRFGWRQGRVCDRKSRRFGIPLLVLSVPHKNDFNSKESSEAFPRIF